MQHLHYVTWALPWWHTAGRAVGSVVAAQKLSCSEAGEILIPPPGIGHESPALQGRLLTPGPPGSLLSNILRKLLVLGDRMVSACAFIQERR